MPSWCPKVHCWSYHRTTLHHGIPFFLPFPKFFQHIRNHHLQMLAAYPRRLRQPAGSSPFQALCSFSKCKKTQDAHHLDITDVLLCCFRFLSSGAAPGFLIKRSFTIFHELRDSIRPRNRSWKHLATMQFFSMGILWSSRSRSRLNYELHHESLHCHQLEEKLDDWCQFWYFLNGTCLSCSSPASWRRRFNADHAVEVRTTSPPFSPSRIIERNPPILPVSKVFSLRHMMGEIFLRELVHLDTDFFSSIMIKLRCTKYFIFQEAVVNPFKLPLDASLSQIMVNVIVSLFFGLPISMAMRSPFLDHVIRNWEKVQCLFNGASAGCTFSQ